MLPRIMAAVLPEKRTAVKKIEKSAENKKMKSFFRKLKAIVAVICLIIYVACAIFAAVSIYNAYKAQKWLAGQEFENLKDSISAAGVLGMLSETFKIDIREKVQQSKSIQAVIITGPKNFALAAEKHPDLIKWDMTYPRFNQGINFLRYIAPAPLNIKDFNNVSISALTTLIDFDDLLEILRRAFLPILIAVVLSFFMLISEILTPAAEAGAGPAPAEKKPGGKTSAGNAPPAEKALDVSTDALAKDIEDAILDDLEGAGPDDAGGGDDSDESNDNNDSNGFDDIIDDTAGAADEEPEESFYEDDSFSDFGEEPNPEEEADFNYYLEPEIQKAEENEADLCLLSAAWENENESIDILVDSALEIFREGTRVFEKTPPGVYIIVPGENIDDCFNVSKKFYRKAKSLLPSGADSNLFIGISSRAGRIVDAGRFLKETESAFEKARENPEQPIVAFKVDLEKYNALIQNAA